MKAYTLSIFDDGANLSQAIDFNYIRLSQLDHGLLLHLYL